MFENSAPAPYLRLGLNVDPVSLCLPIFQHGGRPGLPFSSEIGHKANSA